jgi:hypothetical protein
MCVGVNGSAITVKWPTGGTASFAAPSGVGFTSSDSGGFHFAGEGNIDVYGYGIYHGSTTQGNPAYAEPSCAHTNTCGTGGSGGGVSGCAQQGPISGASKLQLCPPDLGCSNFDTGWNIGADFQWLGCQVEQLAVSIVYGLLNLAIDLVVPDFTAIQTAWTDFYTAMASHVPLNYVTGALSILPNLLTGTHSVPSIGFHLPAPWSVDITVSWANVLGAAAPYRAMMAGFLYAAFAAALIIRTRHMWEN